MTTIFRKVMCSDKLPKKNGSYKTELGEQFFSAVSDWGIPYRGHWMRSANTNPKWWFEEVELPSEEEINELANDFEITCASSTYFGYRAGFNKAIELIKGEIK